MLMHARLSSDLKSVFMILQTHAEVNIRHQSTARCWNTDTVIVGQQCSKTTFFGNLFQVYQRENADISTADVSKTQHLTTKQSVSLSQYIIILDIFHKKHGCPHLCNNKHSVLKRYQYCSFLYYYFCLNNSDAPWGTGEDSGSCPVRSWAGAGSSSEVS